MSDDGQPEEPVRLTENYEEYAKRIFNAFLADGTLPDEVRWDFPDYQRRNEKLDQTMHYLSHVVTDADIRSKDPEFDAFMRSQLQEMIRAL